MKVFLDIGAHVGETLGVVLDQRWGFNRIVCFEPAPSCWPLLRQFADDRVEVHEFGLWNRDERLTLHNPGRVGASMSAEKDPVLESIECDFRDAASWFEAHLDDDDEVFAKINAEGAEVDIIGRLSDAGQLRKIDHLLVHFDVRKIPTLRHTEATARSQLERAEVEYQLAEEIQYGGVERGTKNWLQWCNGGRGRNIRHKTVAKAGHSVRRRLYPAKRSVLDRLNR